MYKRTDGNGNMSLTLQTVDVLKVETLLGYLEEAATGREIFLPTEQHRWLSVLQDAMHPESAPGEYRLE